MGPMRYIAFDLDDVLANLRDPLMTVLNRETGRDIHWRQWTEYELSGIYGASVERIMDWVHRFGVLEAATPEPWARATLEAVRRAGYRVAVVTARGWHPRGETLTWTWLARYALKVDEVHLVSGGRSKAEVLARLGAVEHYVDDHLGHLYPAQGSSKIRQLHVLDRPWNRHDAVLNRLYTLEDLVGLLD
jgi:FMN phosphatase YigB (HAD superfamily)